MGKTKCKPRIMKEEVFFFAWLVGQIGNEEEEARFLDFKTRKRSGIVNYLNKRLNELLTDIVERRTSIEEFTIGDAVALSEVLNCEELDQELLSRLSHQLYGADERVKNFDGSYFSYRSTRDR